MEDFELPNKLYMIRKTFEFGESIYKKPIIRNLTGHFLSQIYPKHSSDSNQAMEEFWAREHACYIALCRQQGKRYSEYLPGREYTYILLGYLIKSVTRRKKIHVLEGGCGSGIACALLASTGATATGIDLTYSGLQFVESISEEYNVQVKKVLGDLRHLPFANDKFNVVFSLGVFEHYPLEIQEEFFRELVRVSKKWVILLVPNKNSPIYKTMSEDEFKLMSREFVYPEEHNQFPVDLSHFSYSDGVFLLESSAIHVVPPKIIPIKHLDDESYQFFEKIKNRALINWNGNAIATWLSVEQGCSREEKTKYGWFSFTIFEKRKY